MRTYGRESFLQARDAWNTGNYGWRWQTIKSIAASRGFIYPPNGTEHDDRESESPSQRAIVYRALMDNPTRLEAIVRRSRSWSEVVDGIIGLEARLATEADELERDEAWGRKDEPTPRESMKAIGSVFDRVAESLGYVRKEQPDDPSNA